MELNMQQQITIAAWAITYHNNVELMSLVKMALNMQQQITIAAWTITHEGYPESKKTFAHTVHVPVLLQPIIGLWCSVWCWKLPHAIVRQTSHVVNAEIAVVMAAPIDNPDNCEVRGIIRFPLGDEILG